MSNGRGVNRADKECPVKACMTRPWRIRLQVVHTTLRHAGPGLAFTVADVVSMHGKALLFQKVAHGNELRPSGMARRLVGMDVAGKNEREIVMPLTGALTDHFGHGLIAVIDLGIEKEERYLLRLDRKSTRLNSSH